MLTHFICPDGEHCPINDCFEKCRMACRCAPISYLKEAARQREWAGKPSVTQLINGTRLEWLRLKNDFAEDPADSAYRIIGTRGHAKLEGHDHDKAFSEEKLEYSGITGIFDTLEIEGDDVRLIDTKTSGSYKIAKAIGVTVEEFDDPILDDTDAPVFFKSGPRKGQPKTKKRKEMKIDPEASDMDDWKLQQNYYRIMVEKNLGYKVTDMFVFAIPRDGDTYIAKNRGVTQKTYMIPVGYIDDEIVIKYFEGKKVKLLTALERNEIPERCSDDECWDGNRCRRFCPVADKCHGNPYLENYNEESKENEKESE